VIDSRHVEHVNELRQWTAPAIGYEKYLKAFEQNA